MTNRSTQTEKRDEECSIHVRGVQDAEWDSFLQDDPLGQYPQSSTWAQFKETGAGIACAM
jgi:hypothetical protein